MTHATRDGGGNIVQIAELLGAERFAHLAVLNLGLEFILRPGLASGNTRNVDSLTADQPELSNTIVRIGRPCCRDTANTEHWLLK